MVNVILCVIAAVMFLAIVAANIYVLVYFQHEEDKHTAWFPKIVTVTGLSLLCISILMLPMDVANSRTNGGIPMSTLWQIVYISMAVLAIGIIPFTIFYYEAEDPDRSHSKQVTTAIKYEVVTVIIFLAITLILWAFLGTAQVPVTRLDANLLPNVTSIYDCGAGQCKRDRNYSVSYQISVVLYIISMINFLGMFLFCVFGGIGLAALPMDLYISWKRRPKLIGLKQYAQLKIELGRNATALLAKGKELQDSWKIHGGRPKTTKQKRQYNKFRNNVYLLDEDFRRVEKAYGGGAGPLIIAIAWGWVQLFLSLIGGCLSILWFIHIIVFVVIQPPASPFLNDFFITLDSTWGLFGTFFYGIFAFWLLWCVIKGNFKFGLRVPFLFSIHPMKVGETMMNSFLFNTLLLMLASVTITQFCSDAFSLYNRFTGIYTLFSVGVRYLIFFRWFWKYYFWALFGFGFLSLLYLAIFPSDRKQVQKELNTIHELP